MHDVYIIYATEYNKTNHTYFHINTMQSINAQIIYLSTYLLHGHILSFVTGRSSRCSASAGKCITPGIRLVYISSGDLPSTVPPLTPQAHNSLSYTIFLSKL